MVVVFLEYFVSHGFLCIFNVAEIYSSYPHTNVTSVPTTWWKMTRVVVNEEETDPSSSSSPTFVLENDQGLYLSSLDQYTLEEEEEEEEAKASEKPNKTTFSFRGRRRHVTTERRPSKVVRRSWRATVQPDRALAIELEAYCPLTTPPRDDHPIGTTFLNSDLIFRVVVIQNIVIQI